MINFGKWLVNSKEEPIHDFAYKSVKDEDYILLIKYKNNKFKLDKFYSKKDFDFNNYFEKSIFSNDFLISTDQRVMIPDKRNLSGLSPFFIKLDNDFIRKNKNVSNLNSFEDFKENNLIINKKYKTFYKKIERSCKENEKENDFVKHLKIIYDNIDEFKIANLNDKQFDRIKRFILRFFKFILKNNEKIVSEIINLKINKNIIGENNYKFYISCCFGNELDLINDLFVQYSTRVKNRKQNIKNYEKGVCSICGNSNITYPFIGSYSLDYEVYIFNYTKKMINSHLRICKECNYYFLVAEDILLNAFRNSMMIIPKPKTNRNYENFVKILNSKKSSFSKINYFLKRNENDFNYDLVIYYKNPQYNNYEIKKYIENYQSFFINFNNNIKLYDKQKFNYLFNENFVKNSGFEINEEDIYINNLFDLEKVFKSLFIKIEDGFIKTPNLNHFFEIYSKDLLGSSGVLYGFDSKTISIFNKYMDNIFSYIYELNKDVLNKKLINEIVLNSLLKLQIHEVKHDEIKKISNYYMMINKEFLGDLMLDDNNMTNLREIFGEYSKDNKSKLTKISFEDENKIKEILSNDFGFTYYLLGQFIYLIDIKKVKNGKKGDVFSVFISNCNKNNFNKLFATVVLQKNNFYIESMNIKGKFVFKILNSLFDEKSNISFEDSLILMFIGYYTINILS